MSVDLPSDPLGSVLHRLRLTESCYCRTELTAPWGLEMGGKPNLVFHYVAAGQCWLQISGRLRKLAVGELAVLPHGTAHRLLGAASVPPGAVLRIGGIDGRPGEVTHRSHGGGGEPALVLCGAAAFSPADRMLASSLPELLSVSGDGGWVAAALELMEAEAKERRAGGETLIARLCDILLIHAIREWLAASPDARRGWVGAASDPSLGRALALIEAAPGRRWTVASLAAVAHLSRPTFAERFSRMVGVTPMEFLRRRRMEIATGLLHDGSAPAEVARRVGYGSVAAFSRAYKRSLGLPPSAILRRSTEYPENGDVGRR